MKKINRRILLISASLLFALLVAAFPRTAAMLTAPANKITSAALFLQTTPTPEPEDLSEIGSTDGIVAMGGIIALIIFIPIAVRYKYWARPSSQ